MKTRKEHTVKASWDGPTPFNQYILPLGKLFIVLEGSETSRGYKFSLVAKVGSEGQVWYAKAKNVASAKKLAEQTVRQVLEVALPMLSGSK